jgi:hypothetical protein
MEDALGELLSVLMLTPWAFERVGSMTKAPRHKDTTEKFQALKLNSVNFDISFFLFKRTNSYAEKLQSTDRNLPFR